MIRRGETIEQWRARMENRRFNARRFVELDQAATESFYRAPKKAEAAEPGEAKSRPEKCAGPCERPFRASNRSVRQAPGTVTHHAGGLCERCERHRQREAKKPGPNCKRCQRPFRGFKETAADKPGTVAHSRDGMCRNCVRAVDAERSKEEAA